jgi:cbb3-type cytochrome oxidase maturation protein
MSVVYVIFPLAILLAAVAVAAFIWATRHGQFDDLESPRHRMLLDDEDEPAVRGGPKEPPSER